jgi:putative PIN family toxin of toxin-antitoxin system
MSDLLHAVLDTNVLISALRSRNGASFELLRRIGTPGWRLHISTALLLEYEEVARREAAAFWARPERVEAILNFIAASAVEHGISFRWRPFLSDPDDDFVLELAVSAGARDIVTHNIRNFIGADSLGVTALPPAEFLKLLNTTKP